MNRLKLILTAATLLGSGLAGAAQIYLAPAHGVVKVGEILAVDLRVSDLGNFQAPSLGAFYAEIRYDPAVVALESVTYGDLLGNLSDPDETSWVTTPGIGFVSVDEYSWLFPDILDPLQPDAFTLTTFVFRGLAEGSTTLGIDNWDLADAMKDTLHPTAVTGGVITVPIAPPALLMLSGVPLLTRRRAGRKANRRAPPAAAGPGSAGPLQRSTARPADNQP